MVAFATQSNIQTTGSALAPIGADGSGKSKLLSAAEVRSFASLYSQSELDSVFTSIAGSLSGKQATLVSGTNLKSINGMSLLGSGDLAVSASPAGSSGQLQFNDAGAFGGAGAVTYSPSGTLFTVTSQEAAHVPFCVKGATSQSGNLSEWRNSSGTILTRIDSAGVIRSPITGAFSPVLVTAGGVSINGASIQVQHVTMNGWWGLTQNATGGISLGSGHKIVWSSTASNAPATGTVGDAGIARNSAGMVEVNSGTIGTLRDFMARNVTAVAQSATDIPFVVRGAASQSANLTEWRNSSGTVVASIDPFGWMTAELLVASGKRIFGVNGNITLATHTGAGTFNLLRFGGTGSGVPAIKISGVTLVARLADDSADTNFRAAKLNLSNLPTSNPAVAGEVWNDGGTLKISAG